MGESLEPIVVTIDIDAPVAEVWRAITAPDAVATWWAPGDIAPVVGHRFALDMGAFGSQPCEVLEVEVDRVLRYRFSEDWELEWRLEPTSTGTRLTMVHSGFDADSPKDVFAHTNMAIGWRDTVLPALRAHCID